MARCEIVHGDCIDVMARLPAGSVRLVFADPPYIGVNYGRGAKADQLPQAEYLDWSHRWMQAAARLLAPDGPSRSSRTKNNAKKPD